MTKTTEREPRRWLRAKEAADYVGLSRSRMDKLRLVSSGGPSFRKVGRAVIAQQRAGLQKILQSSKAVSCASDWRLTARALL